MKPPSFDDRRRQREQNAAAASAAADERTVEIVLGLFDVLRQHLVERAGRSTSAEVAATLEEVAEMLDEIVKSRVELDS